MPKVKLTAGAIVDNQVRDAGHVFEVTGEQAEKMIADGQAELVRAAGGKGRRGTETADA
ncbi:hypothetical protein [Patulibacter defluvii]|uniref:hypothetical protein n=1 Tax=Patulibacter defluvii TaxID=3095358 RepID=UPI002A74DF9D|nr:hypothetical protein [Patulibacter sp. DM4]